MTATTIKLYGEVGKKFGRQFKLHVETPAEAVRALCVQLPGFERYMMEANAEKTQFAVYNGDTAMSEGELHLPAKPVIKIVPVAVGAKNGGLTQVIIGAVIIVAAIYTGGAAAAGAGAGAGGGAAAGGAAGGAAAGSAAATGISYSSIAFSLGVAMVLGGVTQMLTPQAKGLSTADSPENGSSYMFNGPVNITRQGAPVPLLYGELYVGSATISAGIYSEDQA